MIVLAACQCSNTIDNVHVADARIRFPEWVPKQYCRSNKGAILEILDELDGVAYAGCQHLCSTFSIIQSCVHAVGCLLEPED